MKCIHNKWGVKVELHTFQTLVLDRGIWSASCSSYFTTIERIPNTHWIGVRPGVGMVVKKTAISPLKFIIALWTTGLSGFWRKYFWIAKVMSSLSQLHQYYRLTGEFLWNWVWTSSHLRPSYLSTFLIPYHQYQCGIHAELWGWNKSNPIQ